MDRRQDPRTIVTPYAFSVHPDLLGRPLATPWQRLGAIGIDGVVIFGLTRIGGLTLAIASAILLIWLAVRKPGRDVFGKLFRIAVGCLGLTVISVTILVLIAVQAAREVENNPEVRAQVEEALQSSGISVDFGQGESRDSVSIMRLLELVPHSMALNEAQEPGEAQAIMLEMAETGRAAGMSLQDIREALESLVPDDAPWSPEGQTLVNEVMGQLRTTLPQDPEVEGPDPAEAESPGTEEGGSPGPEEASPTITDSLALDSIQSLNALVQELDEGRRDVETELRRAESRLAEAEEGGVLDWLFNLIDELGLGFGWGALYLTITHAWWKGTSVGKKILRIRVVMIDKRPLNWWLSFERAGGYAAGLATGLLGFAQIFWDPNRQAIHDKVSETIVIQEGKDPMPGPWMAEGRAQWDRSRATLLSLVLFLLLPALLGCGSGEGQEEEASAADSVTTNILTAYGEGLEQTPPGPPSQAQEATPLDMAIMGYNQGDPEAPIKVLEVSDFGCGYCRRFHEEIYPTLQEVYVEAGLVEWKFIPFVLGMFPHGLEAALASECAGEQDSFFPMQSRLFAHQSQWKNADDPDPVFFEMAREEGLDIERFQQCLGEGWRDDNVRANIRLGRQIGVRGTPTFLVEGVPLSGALPLNTFRDILDIALTRKGLTPPAR